MIILLYGVPRSISSLKLRLDKWTIVSIVADDVNVCVCRLSRIQRECINSVGNTVIVVIGICVVTRAIKIGVYIFPWVIWKWVRWPPA